MTRTEAFKWATRHAMQTVRFYGIYGTVTGKAGDFVYMQRDLDAHRYCVISEHGRARPLRKVILG